MYLCNVYCVHVDLAFYDRHDAVVISLQQCNFIVTDCVCTTRIKSYILTYLHEYHYYLLYSTRQQSTLHYEFLMKKMIGTQTIVTKGQRLARIMLDSKIFVM